MGQLLSSSALHSTLTQAERLLSQHQPQDALDLLKPLLTQYYQHVPFLLLVGLALYRTGKSSQALLFLQQIIKLEPNHFEANKMLAELYHEANNNLEALTYINKSLKIKPKNQYIKEYKSMILSRLNRYEEAINIIEKVVSTGKPHRFTWNNLAQLYQHTGQSKQAKQCLEKSIELSEDDDTAYNNLIVLLHYLPNSTQEQLKELLSNWECKYAKHINTINNLSTELTSNKKLRIGMISDGFRAHPVGQMITSALEALPQHELELYTYSTNLFSDAITERIKEIANHWMTITHLNDEQLANQLVEDKIDILFDLCGHNNGSRMQTMAMKPAPILVKWVGGLINTTGLSTMDYLLSDHIETPSGVDDNYTEKLIRLPDDYICYNPPLYTPNTVPPPALHNNFITLGCFNNTAKLNPELLSYWAKIMHDLPQSKLLLKSFQINSETLCNNIKTIMRKYGINEDRLLLEGPAKHEELLKTYNKVDIALDPWPYSGGLTTCEALFMGVPVVTLPGPTFAGRHSATHLTNVGLGQLVAEDWQHYHDIVVNLASDLDNLANIRTHLRTALLESPVCDAPRFARNFSNAMRAIWQRHCEGKKPAALSLDKDGNAQFADEDRPVELQLPEEPITVADNDEFRFQFKGKIITLDNGASLTASNKFTGLQRLGALDVLCLDAASRVINSQQLSHVGNFHYFPMTVLGDGSKVPLYVTLDPTLTSSLKAITPKEPSFFKAYPPSPEVMAEIPIQTIALDTLQVIEKLDWLVLDRMHNPLTIIEHGKQKLTSALVVQVGINLQPLYQEQADFSKLSQRLSELGFRFLTLSHLGNQSHFAGRKDILAESASELPYVDAIFIPNDQRLREMDNNSKTKLAFLLHSAYQLKDISYQLLASIDTTQAENYLLGEKLISSQDASNHAVADTENKELTNKPETTFALPSAPAMTEAERQLFAKHLKKAQHYFEFGSGGSTVWAVEHGLTVQGVESDPTWVNALQEKLGQQCQVAVADIGPTGDWGYPLQMEQSDKFPRYSQAILEHQQPFDLILIDGRFRVACTMAAIQHIAKHHTQDSAIIFIHDFWNRPHYHAVLEFLDVIKQVESAGVFKVKEDAQLNKLAEMWLKFSVNPD
ncbi:hypothetical protein GCM10011502_17970 [Oceanisphaera marina]|uniref:protein O-GlcNAc transferase n=1 Tax=Oceanisphaera marina TaxID=2017550 RepID=A0ABQ1ILH1_9GAMM|nr:tetratricopeptide repeat protein [Oceanisphaera marina]GGB45081.1 hypothetical protein GCM10011502_17970 [Oceanisphaera marina]